MRSSTEMPSENGQGGVRFREFGISEYVSRTCRFELVEATYRAIDEEIRIKKNFQRRNGDPIDRSLTTPKIMSIALEVTRRTIRRWKNSFIKVSYNPEDKKGIIADNVNTRKIVNLSFKYAPEKTLEILQKDLDQHWVEFYKILADVENGQGGVRSQPLEVVA